MKTKLCRFLLIAVCACQSEALAQPVVTNATASIYATVTDPIRLAFAPDGTLYAGRDASGSGGGNGDAAKINRIAPGGSSVTEFGNVAISDPDAVIVDVVGTVSGLPGAVLVGGVHAQTASGKIVKIAPDGTVTTLFGPSASIENPTCFLFDSSGRLYFTEWDYGRIFATSGGAPVAIASLSHAAFLAEDAAGRLVASSSDDGILRLYAIDGTLINGNFATVKAGSPLVRGPGGAWGTDIYAVAADGDLICVDLQGKATNRIGSGFGSFMDIQFGPDGALYASDFDGDRVWRFVPGWGNDNFAGAWPITSIPYSTNSSNANATCEPGEPNHYGSTNGHSVWWTWTATNSGPMQINCSGSSIRSVIGVYTGASVSGLTWVASGRGNHLVNFAAVAGATYRIALDSLDAGSYGNFIFRLSPGVTAPANDAFASGIVITGKSYSLSGLSNSGATKEPGEPAHAGDLGGKSVWWRWTAPASGVYQLETTGSTFDTLLAVYTGDAPGGLSLVASNDNYSGTASLVTFTAAAGMEYRFAVDGWAGKEGLISLTLSQPSNDSFAAATLITVSGNYYGVNGVYNTNATKETGEPNHAGNAGGKSLWWVWTAPSQGSCHVDTIGSAFNTLLAVYSGSAVTNLTLIAANDDSPMMPPASELSFDVEAGAIYHIAVDGFDGASGWITMNLLFVPATPSFTFAASTVPVGDGDSGPDCLATADVNGDGRLDLISANYGFRWALPGDPGGWNTALTVLTNDGSGGFGSNATLSVDVGPASVVAVDVNGDGKPDLISANQTANTLTVLTNKDNGFAWQATLPAGNSPSSLVAADLNGDWSLDLGFLNSGDNTLTVLTNDSHGLFAEQGTYPVGAKPIFLITTDINNDRRPDLISVNHDANSLTVLTNHGSGGFGFNATLSVGSVPVAAAAGDVNGDGQPDVVAVNWGANTLTVLTNNGAGVLGFNASLPVGTTPSSVAVGDFNGDGAADLICANTSSGAGNSLTVYTNAGGGIFSLQATLAMGSIPTSLLAADVNSDGRMDVSYLNFRDGTLTVLLNTTRFAPAVSTPTLTIEHEGSGLRVAWPSGAPGWSLQQKRDLAAPNWLPSGHDGYPFRDDRVNKSLTLPAANAGLFLRLVHP